MRVGEERIELGCFERRLPEYRMRPVEGQTAVERRRHQCIRVGQACVRRCKGGFSGQHLPKQRRGVLQTRDALAIGQRAAPQEEPIGFHARVVSSLSPAERQPQRIDDRPRDVVLNGEQVGPLPVEAFGP